MFNLFKSEKPDLEFLDSSRAVYPHYPPVLAKDLKPLKEHQELKFDGYNFPLCPGMHDYARMGYIIPAWSNFHIKANKAGSVALVGNRPVNEGSRGTPIHQPRNMDVKIVDGLFEYKDGIEPTIFNFPGPWMLHGNGNISALLMPAFYHAKFLDDLYVYPGVVDYNGFTTINFICSPKRKCEIEIKAGDPAIHVIPFITEKTIISSYGPATNEEQDYNVVLKWFHELNFYRKYYMIRKKYKLIKKDSE
jgi:hypothetical protein